MRWDFHGIVIGGQTNDEMIRERWVASFAARPASQLPPTLHFNLNLVSAVPPPPPTQPQFRQTDLLEYYLDSANLMIAHFPRYGQLRLDLDNGTTHGEIISSALTTYGVFEDLVAIGLSPHLRRRGMFLLHAFAGVAPLSHGQKGVLIVGQIGSGKTTTGMALLEAGWKLLSNDSPIISAEGEILSYPGLIAAYPNTLNRFISTQHLAPLNAYANQKVTFRAEGIWPGVWVERARPAAIFFPQIESRADHLLEPLAQPEALRLILPHAIEQWDREMIPTHLALLKRLVETATAFRLRLGPDMSALPDVVAAKAISKEPNLC